MFMTVDYVRKTTVKKLWMANMDRLSICSSSVYVERVTMLHFVRVLRRQRADDDRVFIA